MTFHSQDRFAAIAREMKGEPDPEPDPLPARWQEQEFSGGEPVWNLEPGNPVKIRIGSVICEARVTSCTVSQIGSGMSMIQIELCQTWRDQMNYGTI